MTGESVKNLFVRKNAKTYAAVAIIYLIISMVIFWPLLTNITSTVVNGGGDVYQSLWNIWWTNYAIFTLHTSPYFTNLLFYPVGANLVTQTLTPLSAIISAPLEWVSLPFAYNVIFFLAFMLSGLFMYMLAYYLTGNKYAAFIAGLIFAFSPMHMAQSYGHLDWTVIEFIPLFVLFFLLMVKDKKLKYSLGAAASFILLTFMGDIEQGIIVVVLAFFILLYYLILKNRKQTILNKDFIVSLGAMVGLTLLIGAVFFIPIIFGALSGGVLSSVGTQSGVAYNEMWSQNVLSFFLPSSFNSFFQGASSSYNYIFTPDPTERVAYVGYSVLILAIIGLYYDFKEHKLSRTAIWIGLAIIFAWLSLGPYVQIGGANSSGSFISGIPGLYLLYSYIPLFNIVREPGRFDVIVTLALAIIAAFGVSSIMRQEKLSSSNKKKAYALVAIISLIILYEYSGIALPGQFTNSMYLNATIPNAYTQIGQIPGNFTMMILPDVTNATHPDLYTGMSEYFQTAFKKQMVGGYTSRVTANQTLSVELIPLSQSSAYLEQGYGFIYPSPIEENVSNVDLLLLASYKVGFISVIRSAYNYTNLNTLYGYLYSLFGQPVYESNSTIVFSTNNALVSEAGKIPVEYTVGTWIPGYAICTSYYGCNATVEDMWWGPSLREIEVFAPENATQLTMTFNAVSVTGPQQIDVLVNTPQNTFGTFNLGQNITSYNVNVTFQPGYNNLYIYNPSQTEQSSLDSFGIANITFSTR